MKLFIKILLFAFIAFIANVKVVSATITSTDIQKVVTSFSFHKEISKMTLKVIENDLANCCQNEWDLVDYRNWDKGVEADAAKGGTTVLEGAAKSNYGRFVSKMPANAKSSATFKQLKDGNYLFEATSPGKVPGSSALYQKWVNPQGETFKMIKTTFAPDGSIIHVKPKF